MTSVMSTSIRPAREAPPVRPVADEWVELALPELSPQVAALVQLQRLTGRHLQIDGGAGAAGGLSGVVRGALLHAFDEGCERVGEAGVAGGAPEQA